MVSAHEREDKVPARIIPHKFQGIFQGLGAADIEMDPALLFKSPLAPPGKARGEEYLLLVNILACELGKTIDLFFR